MLNLGSSNSTMTLTKTILFQFQNLWVDIFTIFGGLNMAIISVLNGTVRCGLHTGSRTYNEGKDASIWRKLLIVSGYSLSQNILISINEFSADQPGDCSNQIKRDHV